MELSQSRSVSSNQQGIHKDLQSVVSKHLNTEFKKPYAGFSEQTFEQLNYAVNQYIEHNVSATVILDSCCGVAESSYQLALANPQSLVIGIDKSENRLDKQDGYQQQKLKNLLVVRGDLNDLWRMIAASDWPISDHYLLYPNPWPKSKHLGRRWHGAPVFKYMLKLGTRLTVRSNWPIYVDEFQQALRIAGVETKVYQYHSEEAMTPFERKYWLSGQKSYQLVAELAN